MKNFLRFILIVSVLVVAEYYFFTELFADRQLVVLIPALVVMLASIFVIYIFAKKNILRTKHH